jgi:transposase
MPERRTRLKSGPAYTENRTDPLGAVKHSILCACWHMLTRGELYREAGSDYFSSRDPERATRRLVAQLERLGHHVTLEAAAA